MTIRHIKIFAALCACGCNTTKAAESFHMTQPAVSLAIREMEQYYGTCLLYTSATEDELYTFYNDMDYPPAQEGDIVTLHVKALDQSSLDALEQSGLDTEGKTFWFVYLVSQPA